MKQSYKYLIPVAAIAFVATSAYGVQQVSAASNTSSQQTLTDRLVATFGLDKAKVQAVIDADRSAHGADREAAYESRLDQAVTDGKITSAQKALIIAEHKKLEAARDARRASASTETQAQRESNMKAVKAEIDAWAKANNIDASYLMGMGRGHGPGSGQGMMHDGQ